VKLFGSRSASRQRGPASLGVVLAMLVAMLPLTAAAPALAAGPVAFDMVGSASQNLTSYTNPFTGAFGSAGDGFQKYQRWVSATIPYSVLDDSLSIYTGDNLGIIKEGNTDIFLGVTDTVNGDNAGPVTATWVFDVSSASNMALSIDMGAMGDFESSDYFTWEYSIDGGATQTAFASTVDEAGANTYTLEGGASFTLNDPMLMDGTILTDDLGTFTTAITGTGSTLTLTLTASTNGGSETFTFQNIIIDGGGGGPSTPNVYLSEIHYDNAGGDVGEFVEVSGDAGADLSGWSIVLYNGSTGASYNTIALSGVIPNEDGSSGALAFYPSSIQNGSPDGFAIVNGSGTVLEFLSYEGSFTASNGPAAGLTSTDIGVAESSGTGIGQSLQLLDGAWVGPTGASPGLLNTLVLFGACGDPATLINEVQGPGSASPLAGDTVEIEGIVVGDFQVYAGSGFDEPLDGFMLQEEDGDTDGDPATSEGVFVYDPGGTDVSVGDLVRVQGTVSEFFDLTEVSGLTDLAICSSGNALPTPASPVLPTSIGDPAVDWEAMEGMSVLFGQPLFVTGLCPHSAFGEVQLSAIGAQDHPNQVAAQGSTAAADLRQLNLDSRVTLDDGEDENESFPNDSWNPSTTPYLVSGTLRSGDRVDGLSGVVHYSFSEYEVQPVNTADPTYPAGTVTFTRVDPRPAVPAVGGTLKVASFNVLNYFTTFGSRGADDLAEFERQAAKIVDAIIDLDADVMGLMEIENNGTAIADLVTKLNAAAGATRTYGYIDTGVVGGDAIVVGFIYDTATVDPVGDFAILDSSISPAFLDARNRPAVAQTFEEVATRNRVTVAVNHLKSKGSSCDGLANPGDAAYGVAPYATDPELADFAGNCNLTRTAAATVLGQWLDADPTGTGAGYALVIGDLNAYANEDPITALEGLGFTDLHELYDGGNSWQAGGHTYVYDGELGSLDYAMGNPAVMPVVTGATAWHINADEPFALDYNDYNPAANYTPDQWKASDHDPVIVGLAMPIVPRRIKEVAIAETEALMGVGTATDDRILAKVMEDLERSLDESRWTSDFTLDASGGAFVFERERQAVSRLLSLSPAVAAASHDIVNDLVLADRELTVVAIAIASAAGEDTSKALVRLTQGDEAAADGDPETAIQRYMQAWQKATL